MRAKRLFAFPVIAFAALAAVPVWAAADGNTPPAASSPVDPSQPKTAAPPAATKEPSPPPSVTVIGAADAHGVLGREVRSQTDEDMGRIVDVIVDRAGQVRAAVIDFGGLLGASGTLQPFNP